MKKKTKSITQFLIDYAIDSGNLIRKKKQKGQRRMSIRISEQTYKKFVKHVKDDHFGMINGPLSLETEKAMILYLQLYE